MQTTTGLLEEEEKNEKALKFLGKVQERFLLTLIFAFFPQEMMSRVNIVWTAKIHSCASLVSSAFRK